MREKAYSDNKGDIINIIKTGWKLPQIMIKRKGISNHFRKLREGGELVFLRWYF